MKKYLKGTLLVLLIGGVAMGLVHLAGKLADKVIFQPPADTYPELSGVEMLEVEGKNNIAVRFSAPAQKDGLVFLHCHGNAENLRLLAWRQEMFVSRGYGFCAFDYEGYGRSSGKVSEQAVDRDVMRVRVPFLPPFLSDKRKRHCSGKNRCPRIFSRNRGSRFFGCAP